MSRLTLLGTGTCQIEFERRASSILLELDGFPILFDCGHGIVQRLLEVGIPHNQLHHIVISHFHPDHVSDLIPFLHAGSWSPAHPRKDDLHIYGPAGLQHWLDGMRSLFSPSSFQTKGYRVLVHELEEGAFTIGPYPFEFLSLPPSGNHGLRFRWNGKQYAFTGDSHFHQQEITFLQGVDLAVIDSGHLSDEQIVELAARSQAKHILCSHLYRELDATALQREARARGYAGTISIGRDLLTFFI
ncbi:ribonuclease BN (tRNA processing enzyme) [Thermosporothrix hazakensis]|uniref:Ribonuclease BN (tRNA processing enzyme) n=1 Tax=Thermosporothrix hazakensis TaxID=644383 RepID=A0A326U400_THEHA|nr:ribonuclease Z [Thermosporothrix hazakensis]PZW26351.1 ribonuclease BN (tRNA processing enzyme) [Thermosporothrix hazakensis]GCE48698.1 hypothetical protein KTH_35670 [Thermosporothrix hazakensis]